MLLAGLAMEVGFPASVLNIVHDTHDVVNHICDVPNINLICWFLIWLAFTYMAGHQQRENESSAAWVPKKTCNHHACCKYRCYAECICQFWFWCSRPKMHDTWYNSLLVVQSIGRKD